MKRYLAMVMAAVLILTLLTGCEDGAETSSATVSATESTASAESAATESGAEDVSYMATEPLPPEIAEGGAGNGNMKRKDYLCETFNELHGFLAQLPTKGPDKVTSLPVYKNKYPIGQVTVTEEMKAGFEQKAKEFITAAGYGEDVLAGLTPDEYSLNESDIPAYVCELSEFRIRSQASGITVSTELSGITNEDEAGIRTLLEENSVLSAACSLAGIDEPVITYKKDYDRNGDEYSILYSIYQKGKDEKETFLNRTFSAVTIMAQYASADVVIGINTGDTAEYIGDYALTPYNKALNTLRKDCGIKNKDVLGYEIEYTGRLNEEYFIPYYKFYYIAPDKAEVMESLDVTTDSLEVFTEYYIRAVSDEE